MRHPFCWILLKTIRKSKSHESPFISRLFLVLVDWIPFFSVKPNEIPTKIRCILSQKNGARSESGLGNFSKFSFVETMEISKGPTSCSGSRMVQYIIFQEMWWEYGTQMPRTNPTRILWRRINCGWWTGSKSDPRESYFFVQRCSCRIWKSAIFQIFSSPLQSVVLESPLFIKHIPYFENRC